MNEEQTLDSQPVRVQPWPSETPLFLMMLGFSALLWLLLALSIVGIIYALAILLAVFLAHVVFVTHIRGSAIRLSERQLPELWQRVEMLSQKAGLSSPPEAYLLEAGGQLNAFATRFLGRPMMVLYSDLLDACEGDDAARDMIIGHELGHIRAGHLGWLWFLAPASLVPFLGAAYSRAREYTCDRWGAALCGSSEGALNGLIILAAGKQKAPHVDLAAFAEQTRDLDTGFMTLGRWLSNYPPLCERVGAIGPGLEGSEQRTGRGALRATGLLTILFALPMLLLLGLFVGLVVPAVHSSLDSMTESTQYLDEYDRPVIEDVGAATAQVNQDLDRLGRVLQAYVGANEEPPSEINELRDQWSQTFPDIDFPSDPFDGFDYGFSVAEDEALLWSTGPDADTGTDDDIDVLISWSGTD